MAGNNDACPGCGSNSYDILPTYLTAGDSGRKFVQCRKCKSKYWIFIKK
jgi:uncharacterized protein with PIN domain